MAETGKITSFSVFAPKDPFVQQVVDRQRLGTVRRRQGRDGEHRQDGDSVEGVHHRQDRSCGVTIVTVNGARQVLEPGMKFPAADPALRARRRESGLEVGGVGVVGGAYSGGSKTTTLKVGKPLTLVNTTTDARYKISLVSVGSGDTAAAPAKP